MFLFFQFVGNSAAFISCVVGGDRVEAGILVRHERMLIGGFS